MDFCAPNGSCARFMPKTGTNLFGGFPLGLHSRCPKGEKVGCASEMLK